MTHTDYTNYTNYGIDASDIWAYECDCYWQHKEENRDKNLMIELYKFLHGFYLLANHEPMARSSDESSNFEDYRKYLESAEGEVCFSFFLCAGKVYSMQKPCEVFLKGYNYLEFERLFILKLRQYLNGLSKVEDFLKYQLKANFRNKPARLQKFLKLSLLQYPDKIDRSIVTVIDNWFLDIEKRKRIRALKPKLQNSNVGDSSDEKKTDEKNVAVIQNSEVTENAEKESPIAPDESTTRGQEQMSESEGLDESISGNNLIEIKKERVAQTALTESQTENSAESLIPESVAEVAIPEGYELIPGNFTKEEITDFFSFLYKEKSKEGETFLQEKEVTEIFKYGLAIPLAIPGKKYKLNCSLKFPKGIVEFCIYKFIILHSRPQQKRSVLKFFANYIVDFEKALVDKKSLQLWSNNVVGARPEKMDFALDEYLPERTRDSTSSNRGTKNVKDNS